MSGRTRSSVKAFEDPRGGVGHLLVQAHHAFASAMEAALHDSGLTWSAEFGTLSVVVAEPGLSAADLARAVMVTPQAVNLLVNGLERDGLVERSPHPTHGRILEIHPTAEGRRCLRAAYRLIRGRRSHRRGSQQSAGRDQAVARLDRERMQEQR